MNTSTPNDSRAARRAGVVLDALALRLRAARVDNNQLVAELLVANIMPCPRLELYARYDEVLNPQQLSDLEQRAERVAHHEPVQYVLGEVDFMGCILRVDRRALIPRPETEQLVERVLACDGLWQREEPHVADVGTGCGCIVLALATRHPHAKFIASDVSTEALCLARENADRARVTAAIDWREADLLAGVAENSLDVVVANLPYIPSRQCKVLPENVRLFEPLSALDGGPDGLSMISRLVKQAPKALKSNGWVFLETGEEQAEDVKRLMESDGWRGVAVERDLAGRNRIVHGTTG